MSRPDGGGAAPAQDAAGAPSATRPPPVEAPPGAERPTTAAPPPEDGAAGPAPWYPAAKRIFDAGLALVQAVVCLPAWILVPVAIKLDDGGSVFHGQERVGRGGEPFRSWKFRSMRPRTEGDAAPRQAELEEHRVTRVGRLLRASALDELPQLWNIFVGDMSYVGPRSLLPEERTAATDGEVVRLEELPGYELRHRVRPGLTGLAQVRLPRDASHVEKFRLDVHYVRHRSLALDLRLVLRSIWISLRGAWPEVGRGGGADRTG